MRCVQTLEPLAVALDLPIETTDLLAEGADGTRAHDLLLSLGNGGHAIACCTHGDVLSEVADSIARSGVTLDGPHDAPVASSWILDVDVDRVLSARFVEQPPR